MHYMKRRPFFIFLFSFVLMFQTFSFAAEIAAPGPLRKLQRGFLNIALSPMEISQKVVDTQRYDTALPTWAAGIVKGSLYTVSRMVVGAYEMITAPIPAPSDYRPVMQPEFMWEYLDQKPKEPKQANIKA